MNKLIAAAAAVSLALIGASCSNSEPATVATESAETAAPAAETTVAPAAETTVAPAAETTVAPVAETTVAPAAETTVAPAAEAPAVQTHEFSIINDTRVDIFELYLSPATSADWEEDILGEDVLIDGDTADFVVDLDDSQQLWDLLMVDEEGNSIEFYGIDLFSAVAIALEFDEATGEGTATLI